MQSAVIPTDTENAVHRIYSAIKSAFRLRPQIPGPPKLPLEMELQIFELCVLLDVRKFSRFYFWWKKGCMWLVVLIIRRLHAHENLNARTNPILLENVTMEDFGSVIEKRNSLGQFL